jgi:hypothetical protein
MICGALIFVGGIVSVCIYPGLPDLDRMAESPDEAFLFSQLASMIVLLQHITSEEMSGNP